MSYINQTNNQDNPQKIESSEGLIYAALKMQPSGLSDQFMEFIKEFIKEQFWGACKSKPVLYIIHSPKEIMKMRKTRLKKLWKQ